MMLTRPVLAPRMIASLLLLVVTGAVTASDSGQVTPTPMTAPAAANGADLKNGEKLYVGTCLPCHGDSGQGGPGGGAPLMTDLKVEDITRIATNGQNAMPSFGTAFTPAEINDIANYIVEKLLKL